MMAFEAVRGALLNWPGPIEFDGKARVATQCLYGSNGSVGVVVEGGTSEFLVHDDGGAIDEAHGAGATVQGPQKIARPVLQPLGLAMDAHGVIRSPRVGAPDLIGTIVLVANASKEVARELLLRAKRHHRRNIRGEMARLLETKFPKRVEYAKRIIGSTNKSHRFDYVIRLPDSRQFVLDVVLHDPNSINSAVVSHIDLERAKLKGIEQRIIYDDDEPWSSADLSLLRVGARPVPYSEVGRLLDRMAA